jgi:hypothetical protein
MLTFRYTFKKAIDFVQLRSSGVSSLSSSDTTNTHKGERAFLHNFLSRDQSSAAFRGVQRSKGAFFFVSGEKINRQI